MAVIENGYTRHSARGRHGMQVQMLDRATDRVGATAQGTLDVGDVVETLPAEDVDQDVVSRNAERIALQPGTLPPFGGLDVLTAASRRPRGDDDIFLLGGA